MRYKTKKQRISAVKKAIEEIKNDPKAMHQIQNVLCDRTKPVPYCRCPSCKKRRNKLNKAGIKA